MFLFLFSTETAGLPYESLPVDPYSPENPYGMSERVFLSEGDLQH